MVDIEVPEMMNKMAYDRAIVVFSPEGRLYQVEYALKAVEISPTSIGITFRDGVVLFAAKRFSKLLAPESGEKILKIDEHIAVSFCGMAADARFLIDYARVRAQVNRITFNEPITVQTLVKQIANRKQQFTQVGGIRPFGISFLIAGSDGSEHLFETDPAGTIYEWKAHSIGRGAKVANQILERDYKPNMTREQTISLGLKALRESEKKITVRDIEIGVVENKKFKKLTQDEIKKYFK